MCWYNCFSLGSTKHSESRLYPLALPVIHSVALLPKLGPVSIHLPIYPTVDVPLQLFEFDFERRRDPRGRMR